MTVSDPSLLCAKGHNYQVLSVYLISSADVHCLRHRASVVQEALSGVWSRHQLFVATHTALHCIFVAAHPEAQQPFLDVSQLLAPAW